MEDIPVLIPIQEHSVGLCSTCNNAATCVYRAKRGFDAVYCESFNDFSAPMHADEKRGDTVMGDSPEKTEKVSDLRPLKGLCVNCANRDSCTLPRPESGVWHCEEYC
ncbi:MAG: hypothetical protein DRP46_05225 [Candidatus Zixiibacteriota bacterium]|nr:MAG: hypothetical protein DRP46_05225 [candidate division Zixibacteria bacterium]